MRCWYSANTVITVVMGKARKVSNLEKSVIVGNRVKSSSISEKAEFVQFLRAAVVKVFLKWNNGTDSTTRRATVETHVQLIPEVNVGFDGLS